MKENVLIITSAGGGGLLQTAAAKEQEIKKLNPDAKIVKKDLLLDWVRKPFGAWAVKKWDKAQRKGNYKSLAFLFNAQPISEYVFWPQIFLNVLRVLFKEEIDRVIDTHPVGTSATIKAIRYYNKRMNKNLILEKVVVDLPTALTTHFFRPIKKLSLKDKKYVRLVTIDPLLEKNETEEEFWDKNCSLSKKQISYEYFFIRDAFKKYQNQPLEDRPISFPIRVHNANEKSMTSKILSKNLLISKENENEFILTVNPNDCVLTILLGSQPAVSATLKYIKKIADLARRSDLKKNYLLFVFSSYYQKDKPSLFKMVYEYALKEDRPKNLSIIPLSFQKEDVIAPIFHRSNATFTRSGGQTIMELLGVMKGQMFIHSETKGKDRASLLKGIYGWESGNAVYLEQKREAKIVTPQTFDQYISKHFNAE